MFFVFGLVFCRNSLVCDHATFVLGSSFGLPSCFCLYFVQWMDQPRCSFAYRSFAPAAQGRRPSHVNAKEPLGWSFHGTKYGQKQEGKHHEDPSTKVVFPLQDYYSLPLHYYDKTQVQIQKTFFCVTNSIFDLQLMVILNIVLCQKSFRKWVLKTVSFLVLIVMKKMLFG